MASGSSELEGEGTIVSLADFVDRLSGPRTHGSRVHTPYVNVAAIGKIKKVTGSVTITRANVVVAQPAVGDLAYEGDVIETGIDGLIVIVFVDGTTFRLYDSAHMVLDEFIFAAERPANSALFRVLKGRFSFLSGLVATTGRLMIDTAVARIQNTRPAAGIGGLAFSVFTIGLIHELNAASADIALLDDGTITCKDLKHGVFEIITKGDHPQRFIVDDPCVSINFKIVGSQISVSEAANTPGQMALLHDAFLSTLDSFLRGQQDSLIQKWEHAELQSTSPIGSSTQPGMLTGLASLIPEGGAPITVSGSGSGGTTNGSSSGPAVVNIPLNDIWDSSSGTWPSPPGWDDGAPPLPIQNVIIESGKVTFDTTASILGLTVDAGAILNIVGGSLTVTETINNYGLIEINSSGVDPTLAISGDVLLIGSTTTKNSFGNYGEIAMLGPAADGSLPADVPANNSIVGTGPGATLENFNNTILGSGTIGHQGDGNLTLINDALGVIDATVLNFTASGNPVTTPSGILIIDTGNVVTNAGLLEATAGGTLQIDDPLDNSGTVKADDGVSTVVLVGTVTDEISGLLEATLGGKLEIESNVTNVNPTTSLIVASDGSTVELVSDTITGGTINVSSTGDATNLEIDGTVKLTGGTVTLSDSSDNYVVSNGTASGTLNNYDLIQGAGTIGDSTDTLLTLNNYATIDANGMSALVIDNDSPATDNFAINEIINSGTIKATGSGGLTIENSTIDNSTFNPSTNSGVDGYIEALAGSQINLDNATLLQGFVSIAATGEIATVGGSSNEIETANGQHNLNVYTVVNEGTLAIADDSSLTLASPDAIENAGTIELNAAGNNTGDATYLYIDQGFAGINGGGQITLSDSTENVIAVTTPGDQLTNFDNTISGAGTIGTGGMVLINNATIDADDSYALTLDPTSLTNTGTLEATVGSTTGGTLVFSNTVVINSNGPLEAYGGYTYNTLGNPSPPSATADLQSGGESFLINPAQIAGINNAGQVIGNYTDSTGSHGFIYSGGVYTPLNDSSAVQNDSGASGTTVTAVSDDRIAVGYYVDASGHLNGFAYLNGTYQTIDDQPGQNNIVTGVNDADQIVGDIDLTSGGVAGFIYSNGTYTTLNDSSAGTGAGQGTYAEGINNSGQIVGNYIDGGGVSHGFIDSNGTFIDLTDSLAADTAAGGTHAEAINNAGQVVGYYVDANGNNNGFLYSNGSFTTLDDPNAGTGEGQGTVATGINDAGQVVGYYVDAAGHTHGFLYANGSYTDVGNLSDFTGTVSLAINDAGQIVINSSNGDTFAVSLADPNGSTTYGTITAAQGATIDLDNATIIYGNVTTAAAGVDPAVNPAGLIDATSGANFIIDATINNAGKIEATDGGSLTIDPSTVTNSGTLEATADSTLVLSDPTVTNTGGTIEAAGADAAVDLFDVTITGGTLETSDGGIIQTPTGATFVNVTLAGGSFETNLGGGPLNLQGTTTLDGTVTFEGGGTFALSGDGAEIVGGSDGGGTLDNYSTISGAGQIGNFGEVGATTLALFNESTGTIDATGGAAGALAVLTLDTGHTITNAGLLEATDYGELDVKDSEIDWTGTAATLGSNGIVVDGTSELLVDSGSLTLAGSGDLALSGTITGQAATDALLNYNDISGSGTISNLTLTNEAGGTIDATSSITPLILDTGATITNAGLLEATLGGILQIDDIVDNTGGGKIDADDGVSAVNIDNSVTNSTGGIIEATNGGDLTISGDVTNSGMIEAGGGTTSGGDLDIAGDVISTSTPGSLTVSGGATLELGGSDAESISFNNDGTGTLKLDGSSDVTGELTNLATGDTIDLAGTPFTSGTTTVIWDGTTLTVDGSPTTFTISGGLPSNDTFAFKGDGGSGTDLVVLPQILTVAPIAAEGVEGSPIDLNLGVSVAGANNSLDSVVLTFTVPSNDSLTFMSGSTVDGAIFTGSGTQTLTLTPSELADLSVTTGNDTNFTLSLLATATDSNGYNYTVPATEAVTVDPLAPSVTWGTGSASGTEGAAIALETIAYTINSETGDGSHNSLQSLVISGIPTGATLSDAAHDNFTITNGSVSVTAAEIADGALSSLAITPSNDTNFTLTVTATEQDSDNPAQTSTATATEAVTVDPLAPSVTWGTGSATPGTEGAAISLETIAYTINSETGANGDGSNNSLQSLVISGIPTGAALSDGHNDTFTISNGSTTITAAEIADGALSSLAITPANDTNFTLTVTATEQDSDNAAQTSTATATEAVTVDPTPPTVSSATLSGAAGQPIALNLASEITPTGQSGDSNTIDSVTLTFTVPTGDTYTFISHDGSLDESFAAGSQTLTLTQAQITAGALSDLSITTATDGTVSLGISAVDIDADQDLSAPATGTETVNVAAGFMFTPNPATLSALEDGGSALAKNEQIGTFVEFGGNPADTYTFTIGGAGLSHFSPAAGTDLESLSTDGSNLSGSPSVYALTVQVNDTTNATNSGALPFDVIVGSSGSDNINLTSLVSPATPTIVYGLNGNDTINASGMSANVWFVGGAGSDTMTGGSGVNTYLYAAVSESDTPNENGNTDIITNFHTTAAGAAANDIISFAAMSGVTNIQGLLTSTSTNVNADSVAWIQSGANTIVYANTLFLPLGQDASKVLGIFDLESEIVLQNFDASDLSAANFVLSIGQPAIAAPSTETVGVNKSLAITGVGLSEGDSASGETFIVTLADTHGILSATGTGVSGSGTTSLVISGSLSQVNADLATLTDTDSTATLGSPENITISATDSFGNTATPQTIAVTVNGLPVITAASLQTTGVGRANPIAVSLAETGNTSGETFTVTLTDTSSGDLSATGTGVSGSAHDLIIAGTLSQVTSDLATLTDKVGTAGVDVDTITVAATDSLGNSTASASTIDVTVAAAPAIASVSAQAVGINKTDPITVGTVTETDAASGETFSATLTDTHGVLSATGGTWNNSDHTLTISGVSLSQLNSDLGTVTDKNGTAGPDDIAVKVTDSFGNTTTETIDVTAAGVPSITAVSAQAIGINQTHAITVGTVSETDAASSETFTATLTDSTGKLSASGATSGSDSNDLTIANVTSLSQLNSDLGTLTDQNGTAGTDNITVKVTDSFGNTTTETIDVTVAGLPSIAVPEAQTIAPNTTVAIAGVSLSEAGNTSGETFTVVLADTNGVLSATGGTQSNSGHTLTFTDLSLTTLNNDLATLTDKDNTTGSDNITLNATDSFNNTATQTLDVTVSSTADDWAKASGGNWSSSTNWTNSTPGSSTDAYIQLDDPYTVTINDSPSIHSLTVSDPNATVTDDGHTLTLTNGLTIDTGATFDGSGKISGTVVNNGTIDASVFDGTLQITGNITGSGSLDIENGAKLELGGTSTNTVAFESSHGTLQIDSSGTSTAFSVEGTGAGGNLGSNDIIDLPNISFHSAADSYNSTTDVITVGNGTVNGTVTIDVAGGIGSGHFTFESDGHGGTEVFDPPANSSGAPVSIGGLGNDNFVFHPDLGADTGHVDPPAGTAAFDQFTSPVEQHWSSLTKENAMEFVPHGGDITPPDVDATHWHVLHNAFLLH